MANPIKIIKAVTNVGSKAMRGKAKSKGFKEPNVKGVSQVTTGMRKANKQAGNAAKVPPQGNKQGLKGSNRDLKKSINKSSWEMMDKQINALRRSDAAMKKIIKKKAK